MPLREAAGYDGPVAVATGKADPLGIIQSAPAVEDKAGGDPNGCDESRDLEAPPVIRQAVFDPISYEHPPRPAEWEPTSRAPAIVALVLAALILVPLSLAICLALRGGALLPRPDTSAPADTDGAREMAIAVELYLADHDDRFPPAMGSARAVEPYVRSYVGNEGILREFNPAGGEVLGNKALAGVQSTSISDPGKTVMFYESRPLPDGRRVVAYADGHVDRVAHFNPRTDVKPPVLSMPAHGAPPPRP
jgi:prepilin-type processing-associated H-X9-DG protein